MAENEPSGDDCGARFDGNGKLDTAELVGDGAVVTW
jgi:hypothetical protein